MRWGRKLRGGVLGSLLIWECDFMGIYYLLFAGWVCLRGSLGFGKVIDEDSHIGIIVYIGDMHLKPPSHLNVPDQTIDSADAPILPCTKLLNRREGRTIFQMLRR